MRITDNPADGLTQEPVSEIATDLERLLDRVKSATGPDRELDGDIALAFGFPPAHLTRREDGWLWYQFVEPDDFDTWEAPKYTGSVDAVLALVERCLPGFVIYSFGNGDLDLRYSDIRAFTGWRCGLAPIGFSIKENPRDILKWPSMHAATAPLAIVAALLTALIAQK